jgi:DNA-binding SARP family transcriptional activator/Tfp pilus assembly protein PilF
VTGSVLTAMEFCLLGPLTVRCGEMVLPVQPGKQRAVLAALLLNANRLVPVDELAEALWGAAPPPSARATIQNYVLRLRKALGDGGRSRISTRPRGYAIGVDADELDVTRFEALIAAAREAARERLWDTTARQARAALELWRGEPLEDVESEFLAARELPRLAEMRLEALETRIDADLHLGRHAGVIGELRRLVAADPLRERPHAQLMLALYRDGRQGEALQAYECARRALAAELGTEPGTRLRELQHQVLTAEPALAAPAEVAPAMMTDRARPVVPRELPAAPVHFAGRTGELAALTRLLDRNGERVPAVVVSAIGGTAGVGKTALAVHWAHQVTDRFPDGQLYVNLRGYDPGQPLAPGEALAGFLAAFGVSGSEIPAEEAGRAAAYRSVLGGRRVLVMLDNARDAGQVRPLLPGEPGCLVLVTSRDMLAGLVARDGARRVQLDVLPLDDAVALLRALIGPRVDAEPQAAARLAGLCCCLPLALRVAAELAAVRPAMSLAELAGELHGQGRLDALEAGADPGTAVRAVFSWSCRYLSPATARVFRLVALHPGPDFDFRAVAALTRTSKPAAGRALAELTRASLLYPVGSDRYGMHDLLRGYAAELADAQDRETGRRGALTRLVDYYLHATRRAAGVLFPADAPAPADAPGDGASSAVGGDERAARAWLDAERANLAAVAAYASEHEWPEHAVGLSAAMFRYLDMGGFFADALAIHSAAARAAIRSGDPAAEAGAVINIGTVYLALSRYRESGQHFQRALGLSREVGYHLGELRALFNLSHVYLRQAAYPDATASCQQALELSRAVGDRVREARALGILGLIALRQGRYRQAAACLAEAAEASREVGDLGFLADSLINLGEVEVRQGLYHKARRHLEEARTTARQIGHAMAEANVTATIGLADLREGRYQQAAQQLQQALAAFHDAGVPGAEADVLCFLGESDLRLGRPAQASGRYQQALAIYQRSIEPSGEAEAHNGLGEAALARGGPGDARAHHQAALAIADQIACLDQQARAYEGLGNLSAATGDPAGARPHWQQALAIHLRMETPDIGRIRAKLGATETHKPQPDSALGTAPMAALPQET